MKNIERHHAIFPSNEYTTKIERHFRRSPELVVPSKHLNHRLLHRCMPNGIPKPTRSEMIESVDFLSADEREIEDPFWGIQSLARYFVMKESHTTSESEAMRYRDTREHLWRQMGFLTLDLDEKGVTLL